MTAFCFQVRAEIVFFWIGEYTHLTIWGGGEHCLNLFMNRVAHMLFLNNSRKIVFFGRKVWK